MGYLATAFIAMWVVVTVYLTYMSRRQRDLEQELKTLEEMMAERTDRSKAQA